MMISLERQIQAVEREIAFRRAVYPKQVGQGRMKQDFAIEELAAMEAVCKTLKDLQPNLFNQPDHDQD